MKAPYKLFALALLSVAVQISSAQQQSAGQFATRDGYDQADFGSQLLTIKTRNGTKSLRVSMSKLRIAQPRVTATIRLPQQGIALLQHAAATAHVSVGNERFTPLEGEWLRLTLPTNLTIGVDNDQVLMDLIVIEDAPGQ